ncbi:MAG: MFS transporter [Sphingomonadales bacterium]|nr:MFS transporter [Sphingomonadales bacterium]MDE2170735.1 MFS transporter [Sphingomonadales bacterium]
MGAPPCRGKTVTRAITIAALATGWLQAVTISIPNAAVFHIGGSLSMQDDQIGWLFSSYIAASAITLPMTGWLAGRYGRKAVLLTSIALFAAGLVLAAQATSVLGFVGARIVQGAASGPLAPLSLAILLENTPPAHHPRAALTATLMVMLGILSGPPLGGWLSEYHDWRWNFWLGLPIALWVFMAMALSLPDKQAEQRPSFDFIGLGSLAMGITGLQMLLDRGERLEWFVSPEIRLEAMASAVGFALYLAHIATAARHFLDKALFRDRNFILSTVMFFAFGFVLLPKVALTSPMLEELLGYPPDTTGAMTIPRSIALLGALILTARAPAWIDSRLFILTGSALTAYASGRMLVYSPLMDWRPVVAAGMVQGAGLGMLMPALGKAAFSTLPPALKPEGMALFNMARLYGSTLGIAVVQWFLADNTQAMHLALTGHVTLHQVTVKMPGMLSATGPAMLNEMVTAQAACIALFEQFKILMFATLIVTPLALLLRRPPATR